MSDDHAAAQRLLLLRASERAVALTKTIHTWGWGRPSHTLKVQGVVAQAWLEGYIRAVDELKATMGKHEHD